MEYYSIKQIADSLNISKQRVYRCIKSNHIKEVHRDTVKGNTVLMYDKASIDRIKQLLGVSDEVHHDTVNDTVNDIVNDTVNDTVNLSELSKRQKDICSLIQTNTNITTAQMAASLKISVSTLRRELSELQKAEIVKRVGSDKKGHWIIANTENQNAVLAK